MTKIGRFKNEQSRRAFLQSLDAMEPMWPLPSTTRDIETSFGSTHVRQSGSGTATPVVLLHQLGGNALAWHIVAADFAADRVIYALDTVGTPGRSVQTAPFTGEADFATWIDEVLTALGLDRVHLVGYSQGAWHATLVALNAPQRIASVTLIEPGGVFTKPKLSILLKMVWFGMQGKSAKNLRKMSDWLSPGVTLTDNELVYMKSALEYRSTNGWARLLKDAELQAFTVPTLVVYGADTLVADPPLAARRIEQHMPQAEVEIFPGKGHGVLMQIPEQVAPRVMTFVRQHDHAPATR